MVAELETPIYGPMPPYGRHAITTHLPGWDMALRFMEKDMTLMKMFKSFYPRMMPHEDTKALIGKIVEKAGTENQTCFPFPHQETVEQCIKFSTSAALNELVCKPEELSMRLFKIGTKYIWTIFFPLQRTPGVVKFWQNTGMGVSSRFGEDCLNDISAGAEIEEIPLPLKEPLPAVSEAPAQQLIRERIADLMNRAPAGPPRERKVAADDVYLFQSGMSSIYSVHQYLTKKHASKSVMFGYAFHSTPHVLADFGPGVKFLGIGNAAELVELETYLKDEAKEGRNTQAIWAEVPSNPILLTADLGRLRKLADEYGCLLIVDDTISSFCNVDFLGVADIVVTSLTKSFSGYADLMAASAVLSPASKRYEEMKALMSECYQIAFYDGDAEVLEKNSRDYMERSKVLNNNAEKLVEFLDKLAKDLNSSVARVYYPTTSDTLENYKPYMRQPTKDFQPGYGCLFSIELETEEETAAFLNNLHVHQGPHLGAHLTLAMPYVKALHGKEMEKVRKYGLSEKQIRISAGLEDTEHLIEVFKHALTFSDALKTKN